MTAHLFLLRQPSTKPSKTQLVCQSRSSLLRFCEGLEFMAIEKMIVSRSVMYLDKVERISPLRCCHVPVNYCVFLQLRRHCRTLKKESMRVTAPEDSRHGSDRRFTKPGYWSREFRHMTARLYIATIYKYGSIQRAGGFPIFPLRTRQLFVSSLPAFHQTALAELG